MAALSPFRHRSVRRLSEEAGRLTQSLGAYALYHYGVPFAIKTFVNQLLKHLPGYNASIDSIDVSLSEGAIRITGVKVYKKISRENRRLILTARRLSLSFEWSQLVLGLCESVVIEQPTFLMDRAVWKPEPPRPESERRQAQKTDWRKVAMKLTPFKIDRLLIHQGRVVFTPVEGQGANEDLSISNIELTVKNVTNNPTFSRSHFVTAKAKASVLSSGTMEAYLEGYPLDKHSKTQASIQIKNVNLVELKELIKSHFQVNVSQGRLDVFSEMTIQEGIVTGYAEPILDGLRIQSLKEEKWADKLKVLAIQLMAKLFRNEAMDRITAKIRFEGALTKPSIEVLGTFFSFVKNAFISTWGSRFNPRPREFYFGNDRVRPKSRFALLKESFSRWNQHEATRMAAALAYYTAFSIAPLLLLVIAVAGLVFGKKAAEGGIVNQLSGLLGPQSAELIQSMIAAAWKPAKGVLAAGVSLVGVVGGAFGVLSELKINLNRIMQGKQTAGIGELIKQRAKYLGFILGMGFLLLVSLAFSAAVSAVGKWMGQWLPFSEVVLHLLDLVLSVGITAVLFALIFKYLPDHRLPWRPVWVGSLTTSLLFTVGKFALGLYLGKGAVGSSYGAAGSVLIILLWVYYSALILYFGAEFTKVYSERSVEP